MQTDDCGLLRESTDNSNEKASEQRKVLAKSIDKCNNHLSADQKGDETVTPIAEKSVQCDITGSKEEPELSGKDEAICSSTETTRSTTKPEITEDDDTCFQLFKQNRSGDDKNTVCEFEKEVDQTQ